MLHRSVLIALSVPFLSGLTVQPAQETVNDKDKKSLQGKWQVVSFELAGSEIKVNNDGIVIVIEGNKLKFTNSKGTDDIAMFTFTLDAGKSPKNIDLLEKDKSKAEPAIYELKGDELTICRPVEGRARPSELRSTRTNQETLLVLKRIKK